MPAIYKVRVYDTEGNMVAELDTWRSLLVERNVSDLSYITVSMYSGSPAVEYFTTDAILEVLRMVPEWDIPWTREFVGFHRTPQDQLTEGSSFIFTSYGRSMLDLLRRRTIRYYAATDGSTKDSAPADDIIKAFVRENAGSLATTANGRLTDGVIPGFAVAADESLAPDWEGAAAWDPLLDTIQGIGQSKLVDFDVVWLGGADFEFRTYYPQLGTDRSVGNGVVPAVTFSPEMGNLQNPSYTEPHTEEVNDVLVLGPGEEVNRDTTYVENALAAAASPWNRSEQNYDARSEDREQALLDAGYAVLKEKQAVPKFAGSFLQTAGTAYGKDYFLGDIVTARFTTPAGVVRQANVKIQGVSMNVAEGRETLTFDLVEPPAQVEHNMALDPLVRSIVNLDLRIRKLATREVALQAWQAPTLAGSWANAGGGSPNAGYWRPLQGWSIFEDEVSGGTGTITTLPEGYRPDATFSFPIVGNSLFGVVSVATTGAVVLTVGAGPVDLAGVSFRADG